MRDREEISSENEIINWRNKDIIRNTMSTNANPDAVQPATPRPGAAGWLAFLPPSVHSTCWPARCAGRESPQSGRAARSARRDLLCGGREAGKKNVSGSKREHQRLNRRGLGYELALAGLGRACSARRRRPEPFLIVSAPNLSVL